ncbi:methyl-accepting chemotaxis protein [Pokkaliibacter sp. CJK22405]|uniref:methyl-accepting chemotaxis protein n=1 Tax=Pokkaliibacter sp. CJK22405 TaxID=3384615 RepID=UPI003984A3DE
MNRISYAAKFILVSLLFFTLIAALAVMVVDNYNQAIHETRKELDGLAQVRAQYPLYEALSHARDARVGYRSFANKRLKGVLDTQSEASATLLDAYDSSALEEFPKSAELWKDVVASHQERQSAIKESTQGLNELFAEEAVPVQKQIAMLETLAWESGLTRDENEKIALSISFAINTLLELNESLDSLRAYGLEITSERYLGNVNKDLLNNAIFQVKAEKVAYDTAAAALKDHSNDEVATALDTASTQYDALMTLVDQQILNASRIKLKVDEYDKVFTETQQPLLDTNTALFDQMQTTLDKRLSSEITKRNVVVAIICLVVLIALMMYLAFYRSVKIAVGQMLITARNVAQGDLTANVAIEQKDEMGQLSGGFNQMIHRVRDLIQTAMNSSTAVASQSETMQRVSSDAQHVINQQRQDIESINLSVHQVADAARQVSEHAHFAAEAASSANSSASLGQKQITDALEAIETLANHIRESANLTLRVSEASGNITQVLDVIKTIAEQTNLLALNAAIEAARAGEQGRGFAVVADEVRLLAQRTQGSTAEIEGMIRELQQGVKTAVSFMEDGQRQAETTVSQSQLVNETLTAIHNAVSQIMSMNQQIAAAAEEQTATADEVTGRIRSLSEGSAQAAEAGKATSEASFKLTSLTQELNSAIQTFKV